MSADVCFAGLNLDSAKLLAKLVTASVELTEGRCGAEAVELVFRAAAVVAICFAKPGHEQQCLERGAMLTRLIAQRHSMAEQTAPAGMVLQ